MSFSGDGIWKWWLCNCFLWWLKDIYPIQNMQ